MSLPYFRGLTLGCGSHYIAAGNSTGIPVVTGVPFNDAHRYMDSRGGAVRLLTEILLVMTRIRQAGEDDVSLDAHALEMCCGRECRSAESLQTSKRPATDQILLMEWPSRRPRADRDPAGG